MNITLERLAHSDIGLLRALRNEEATHFFSQRYITVADQEDWWYRLQFDHSIDFYTIWLNKVTPVGFLSVRKTGNVFYDDSDNNLGICELGHLLLAPAHRGRGIMHKALIEVRRLYDPRTFWIAHVKSANDASLRLFGRQGFVQFKRTPKPRKRKTVIPMTASEIESTIHDAFTPKIVDELFTSPMSLHLKRSR